MIDVQKILVPTDYSLCADAAFKHAFRLAKYWGAGLDVLHVVEGPSSFEPPLVHNESVSDVNCFLPGEKACVQEETHEGVLLKRIMFRGPDVTKIILDHCRAEDIDLIMMGTHGHQSVERFLSGVDDNWVIGKTAEEVVTQAQRPVFTIGPRGTRRTDVIDQVLVPIDFSDHSLRLLCYARHLAAPYGATVRLFHVLEAKKDGQVEVQRSEVLSALRSRFDECEGPEVDVCFEVSEGTPAKEILKEAGRMQSGLILLSSHGHESSMDRRLGVEAEQIIRAAPCPVFTEKTFGKTLLRPGPPSTSAAKDQPYQKGTIVSDL